MRTEQQKESPEKRVARNDKKLYFRENLLAKIITGEEGGTERCRLHFQENWTAKGITQEESFSKSYSLLLYKNNKKIGDGTEDAKTKDVGQKKA